MRMNESGVLIPQGTIDKVGSRIAMYPDHPIPGIIFRDVTPVFEDHVAFGMTIDALADFYDAVGANRVGGIEARGFYMAGALAKKLGADILVLRKGGKLPGEVEGVDYGLEYGEDRLEVQKGSVRKGDRVLLLDDLLATGGTGAAAEKLVRRGGADVVGAGFIVGLPDLKGREKLGDYKVMTMVDYKGH